MRIVKSPALYLLKISDRKQLHQYDGAFNRALKFPYTILVTIVNDKEIIFLARNSNEVELISHAIVDCYNFKNICVLYYD